MVSREVLLRSLARQRRIVAGSIVLTPVDSLPFGLADRHETAFLHGLYLSDKVRDREAQMAAIVQFGGRSRSSRDLASIYRLLADKLSAAAGSMRLLSGLHAHAATFMSIGAAGQKVLVLHEEAGGHFNTRAILERLGLHVIDLPIDHDRLCVDRAASLDLVARERPDFVFVDRSEGLRYEDFGFIGEIEGLTRVFDASQYLPQILEGRYANPLAWGFDLMMFSLHKSFPGPQKAAIVTREETPVWGQLMAGLSTFVSSSHAENTYLAGLTLLRDDWMKEYVQRMLATAVALEAELRSHGVEVVQRTVQGDEEWPPTQHIWVLAGSREEAFSHYENLARSRIHTNYRKLPYRLGFGLRLGTSFAAVAGLDEIHAPDLAAAIAAVIRDGVSPRVRRRVREIAEHAAQNAILPGQHWS